MPRRISLTPVLLRGMSSDNSRIAQRSLQFFRNDVVRNLYMECEDAVRDLLICLLRKGQKHWNQTVNRMTCAVLRYVRDDWKDSYNDVMCYGGSVLVEYITAKQKAQKMRLSKT